MLMMKTKLIMLLINKSRPNTRSKRIEHPLVFMKTLQDSTPYYYKLRIKNPRSSHIPLKYEKHPFFKGLSDTLMNKIFLRQSLLCGRLYI